MTLWAERTWTSDSGKRGLVTSPRCVHSAWPQKSCKMPMSSLTLAASFWITHKETWWLLMLACTATYWSSAQNLKTLEGQTKPSWTHFSCKGCSTSLPALSREFPCAHSHSHSVLFSPVTVVTHERMSHTHLFILSRLTRRPRTELAHLADLMDGLIRW